MGNLDSQRDLHLNVYFNFTYNKALATIQTSNRWPDKWITVWEYGEVWLSQKKEQSTNAPATSCCEQENRPRRVRSPWLHLDRVQERVQLARGDRHQEQELPVAGKGQKGTWWVMEMLQAVLRRCSHRDTHYHGGSAGHWGVGTAPQQHHQPMAALAACLPVTLPTRGSDDSVLLCTRLSCLPQHQVEREGSPSLRHLEGARENSLRHPKRPPKVPSGTSFLESPRLLPGGPHIPSVLDSSLREHLPPDLPPPPVFYQILSQTGSFVSVPTAATQISGHL